MVQPSAESVEETIAAFQRILLKDLKLIKHRQVIHPVLQEGMSHLILRSKQDVASDSKVTFHPSHGYSRPKDDPAGSNSGH